MSTSELFYVPALTVHSLRTVTCLISDNFNVMTSTKNFITLFRSTLTQVTWLYWKEFVSQSVLIWRVCWLQWIALKKCSIDLVILKNRMSDALRWSVYLGCFNNTISVTSILVVIKENYCTILESVLEDYSKMTSFCNPEQNLPGVFIAMDFSKKIYWVFIPSTEISTKKRSILRWYDC